VSTDENEKVKSTKPTQNEMPDKYPTKRGFYGTLWFYLGMLITRFYVHIHAEGKENIPKDSPYVIAANHQTFADGLWISNFIPRKQFKNFACLAASDLETDYGAMGRLMMKVGRGIAVDRYGNPVRGLIKAKKVVEKGNIMLVHPEGTRTHDGMVAEMKDGAAYLAVKANVPMVPVYIEGGYQAWSRHMKRPNGWDKVNHCRRRIILHFGKPLLAADYENNAHKMTEALSAWMHDMEEKTGAADKLKN